MIADASHPRERDKVDAPYTSKPSQFTLRSWFWLTIALALLFYYAQSLGQRTLQQAAVFVIMALINGSFFGLIARRFTDGIFWSILICLLGFLATAGGRVPYLSLFYGWGLVGAVCGGISVLPRPRRWWTSSILMALASVIAMSICVGWFGDEVGILIGFDLIAAACVGAALAPFLMMLKLFEARTKQSKIVMAAWLVLSVILGNYLITLLSNVGR
jgi:hypothetical protein